MNGQPLEISNVEILERKPRGPSKLIGYGYDVTEEYMQSKSARGEILDHKKLGDHILKREEPSTVLKMVVGKNAEDYCQNLSSNLKLGASKAAFSGAISAKFRDSESHSYKYSYGSLFQIINMKKKYISISKSELKNFVSEDFLKYVKNSTVDDIIAQYGTHIITDITLGGRVEITCRSIIQSQEKSRDMGLKLDASVKKMFSIESETDISSQSSKKDEESRVYIQTIGGDARKGITIITNNDDGLSLKSNLDEWKSSLSNENIDLIYMDNLRISLDEVIPDDEEYRTKKHELKEGIEKYIIDREFKISQEPVEATRMPFNRYYSFTENDHFYSVENNEYDSASYAFEGIACDIFKGQKEGTIPIYRYVEGTSGQGIDHLYTTNWNELQNGAIGYRYEGIVGYIYPPNYSQDSSLVPLYRCCRKLIKYGRVAMDHFYTLDRNEFERKGKIMNGMQFEGVLGLVYRPR